ncbi:MAG: aspartate aminotransferase, partial [Sphingobacteriales bacterium]
AIKDQLVIVNGVSKGFAMTGWRLGFCAAPMALAKAMTKIQGQFTSGASSISQMAAQKAFEMGKEEVRFMVDKFQERRDFLVAALNEIPGMKCLVPDGAFYVYPNVEDLLGKTYTGDVVNTDEELCMYLLKVALVALVPGSAFGTPGYLRLSYATDLDTLKIAIQNIKSALA